jgi:hypothetical protein
MNQEATEEENTKNVRAKIRGLKFREKDDVEKAINGASTLMEISILVNERLKTMFHVNHDSSTFPYPLFEKAVDKWVNLTADSIGEAKSVIDLNYARKWGFFYTDNNWHEKFSSRIQAKLSELAEKVASEMTSCIQGHEFLSACEEGLVPLNPADEGMIAQAMIKCEKPRMSCDENARQLFEVLVGRFATLHLSKEVLQAWREIVEDKLEECSDEQERLSLEETLSEIESNKSRTKLTIRCLDERIDSSKRV